MFEVGKQYEIKAGKEIVTLPFLERVKPPHGECTYFLFGEPITPYLISSSDKGKTFYRYIGNKEVQVSISSV